MEPIQRQTLRELLRLVRKGILSPEICADTILNIVNDNYDLREPEETMYDHLTDEDIVNMEAMERERVAEEQVEEAYRQTVEEDRIIWENKMKAVTAESKLSLDALQELARNMRTKNSEKS